MSLVSRAHALMLSGAFWSGMLCMAAITRATSYIERPPKGDSLSSRAIEAFIPYDAWGLLLLTACLAIVIGHISPTVKNIALFGHLLCFGAYLTFATSVLVSALFYGQPWSTVGSLAVVAVLHNARAILIADEVAQHRNGGGE